MEKRFTPNEHLAKLVQSWNGTAFLIGAVIFPLLAFMDIFLLPGHYHRFILYRVAISIILIFLYYLNKLKRNIAYQYTIGAVATALSAVTVEIAVLQSGGQNSPYYAAMLILTVCALGLVPISMGFAVTLVGIIYAVYLVPIILSEPVLSGVFISNNAFLFAMFIIALILRYHNQKLIHSELTLREALSREKGKLEVYSTGLEDSVAEKTGELAVSEQKYRALFENATDGIVVLDRRGTIVNVNNRFCDIHGFPRGALVGTDFRLLVSRQQEALFEARFREIMNGASVVFEADNYRMGGGTVSLEISAKEVMIGGAPHVQLFLRDITARKRLQEHVLQAQKLDSMGVLAGGIAHDFNNVLTAILGQGEVLRRRVAGDALALQRIATIESAAGRAGQMVAKLLSFSRQERFELVPTDVNAVVRETVDLVDRSLTHRNVTISMSLDDALPFILGDRIHIEQVLTNLVLNAADAMPGGGTVSVSTGAADLRNRPAKALPVLAPGVYVLLAVSDTGIGIAEDIRHRIFEPFFTTKPAGKGTGLGLAMAYGIVKSHRGEIDVESRAGGGTTFSLYFPALLPPCPVPSPLSTAE
ncbi:MAG: ATP-binding protein [Nitrospirota bacterium]